MPPGPPPARRGGGQERQFVATHEQFSGPLPPPNILQQYNQAVPNGAERAFKMAENQSTHRIAMENRIMSWNLIKSAGGMLSAIIISIYALYVAKEIAIHGNPYAAAALAALDIGGLISIGLYNTHVQKQERAAQKTASSAPPS